MAKRKRKWHSKIFPCVIFELQPHNPEYEHGYRYRVHNLEDEQAYFADKTRMFEILAIHNFHPIKPETMERLRKKRRA